MFRKSSKKQLKTTQHRIQLSSPQLLEGNLRELVELPDNEDINEWIALNTVEFVEQLDRILGLFYEQCKQACCEMTAGNCQYSWVGAQNKLQQLKAHEYFSETLTYCMSYINNTSVFPLDFATYFPRDFYKIVSQMFKRIFRCYAHCYSAHMDSITAENAGVVNCSFQHFVAFAKEFSLLQSDETEVIEEVLQQMNL